LLRRGRAGRHRIAGAPAPPDSNRAIESEERLHDREPPAGPLPGGGSRRPSGSADTRAGRADSRQRGSVLRRRRGSRDPDAEARAMIARVAALLVALLASAQAPLPATPGNATIRGHVVRADGLPLPRAEVRLGSLDNPLPPRSTVTDEDGGY